MQETCLKIAIFDISAVIDDHNSTAVDQSDTSDYKLQRYPIVLTRLLQRFKAVSDYYRATYFVLQ